MVYKIFPIPGYPDATPTVTVSESEAKAAEDIPAASADEQEEPREEEERVATPPSNQEVVLKENVSDPPATQVEVENPEAATNNTTDANDIGMAEANVAPEANVVPKVNAPEANVSAHVPPPRPHTIEQAYDRGQFVTVH